LVKENVKEDTGLIDFKAIIE